MTGWGRSIAAVAASVALLASCASASAQPRRNPFAVGLGVYLSNPEAGVCTVRPPATVRRCTLAQSDRRIESDDGPGNHPKVPGHVVAFRLRRGKPTPHTTSVEVRFRSLSGVFGPAGPAGPWQGLSMSGPRFQEFTTDTAFYPGDQIAIDVMVRDDGLGEASAPLGLVEEHGPWGIAEWTPPLGEVGRPPHVDKHLILNLSAVFEQDDQTPPRLQYTYSRTQDFLRTGRVYVRVRSDEAAELKPECTLDTKRAAWGLLGGFPHLRAGHWIQYLCEFEAPALRAAREAVAAGGHPKVQIRLIAEDRAGNRGSTPNFYVSPVTR